MNRNYFIPLAMRILPTSNIWPIWSISTIWSIIHCYISKSGERIFRVYINVFINWPSICKITGFILCLIKTLFIKLLHLSSPQSPMHSSRPPAPYPRPSFYAHMNSISANLKQVNWFTFLLTQRIHKFWNRLNGKISVLRC